MHKSSPIRTSMVVFFKISGGTPIPCLDYNDSPAAAAAEVEALLVECPVNSRAIPAKWTA